MRVVIVTPAKRGSTKGNRHTAERWARILRKIGHQLTVTEAFDSGNYDCLIALHAGKSARSVGRFHRQHPGSPVIVALTGTDLHQSVGGPSVIDASLRTATRIVILEPESGRKLKKSFRDKTHVILQSAESLTNPPTKLKRTFEVSVLGHLRPVKDPFRTAEAVKLLPQNSRVKVVHFGEALSATMKRQAEREMQQNSRYQWLGNVSHGVAIRRLARSHLTVLSSKAEGGPAVISEAVMNDVPILASRIDASIGMLGKNHPGLFKVGDTRGLAELIGRAETDKGFYRGLVQAGKRVKRHFSFPAEVVAWRKLFKSIKKS